MFESEPDAVALSPKPSLVVYAGSFGYGDGVPLPWPRYTMIEAPLTADLTFDHVVPRSRGGRTLWTNVVTACGTCNLMKGSRLPNECGMFPRTHPVQPTSFELQENGRGYPPNYLHESWRDFLYWDTELDPI